MMVNKVYFYAEKWLIIPKLSLLPHLIWSTETVMYVNKASQAIQSPRTVPFFLLVSLLDGYSFPNVLVKGIVAFKH